jgi:hypothetical protein
MEIYANDLHLRRVRFRNESVEWESTSRIDDPGRVGDGGERRAVLEYDWES